MSLGFAPFAINDQPDIFSDPTELVKLKDIELSYNITVDWNYAEKESFYPIYVDCDCPCYYLLSDRFVYTEYTEEVLTCTDASKDCKNPGESVFKDYTKDIIDVYESDVAASRT